MLDQALGVAVLGVVMLLAGCSQPSGSVKEPTKRRLAEQYQFENTYTDTDGGDM